MSMSSTTTATGPLDGPSHDDPSAVQQGVEAVKEHAGATADTAMQEAASVAGSAVEHARSLLGTATEELREQTASQVDRVGEMLSQASRDFDRMAQDSDTSSPAGRTVRTLAEATGQVAKRLEEGGPEGVMSDVARFARRRPGTFLALSAVAGFAVARLARSADTEALKAAVQRGASSEESHEESAAQNSDASSSYASTSFGDEPTLTPPGTPPGTPQGTPRGPQ